MTVKIKKAKILQVLDSEKELIDQDLVKTQILLRLHLMKTLVIHQMTKEDVASEVVGINVEDQTRDTNSAELKELTTETTSLFHQ